MNWIEPAIVSDLLNDLDISILIPIQPTVQPAENSSSHHINYFGHTRFFPYLLHPAFGQVNSLGLSYAKFRSSTLPQQEKKRDWCLSSFSPSVVVGCSRNMRLGTLILFLCVLGITRIADSLTPSETLALVEIFDNFPDLAHIPRH